MRDHLLGFPAALNCLPLETRKAHVTPPREVHGKQRTSFERWDLGGFGLGVIITEADCRQVKQSINGAQHGRTCTRSATTEPAANASRPANPGGGGERAAAPRAPAGGLLTQQLEQVSSPAAPPSTTDKPPFQRGDVVVYNEKAELHMRGMRRTVDRSDGLQTWFSEGGWDFTRVLDLAATDKPQAFKVGDRCYYLSDGLDRPGTVVEVRSATSVIIVFDEMPSMRQWHHVCGLRRLDETPQESTDKPQGVWVYPCGLKEGDRVMACNGPAVVIRPVRDIFSYEDPVWYRYDYGREDHDRASNLPLAYRIVKDQA